MSGCNFTELCRLMQKYGHITISSSCVRKRCFAEGILSLKCKRKTRKKLKKILRGLKKVQEITREKMEALASLEQEGTMGHGNIP